MPYAYVDPFILEADGTDFPFSIKVYLILDEFILAGEIQETSKRVRYQENRNIYFSSLEKIHGGGCVCSIIYKIV